MHYGCTCENFIATVNTQKLTSSRCLLSAAAFVKDQQPLSRQGHDNLSFGDLTLTITKVMVGQQEYNSTVVLLFDLTPS
jgi:hypothetical protein